MLVKVLLLAYAIVKTAFEGKKLQKYKIYGNKTAIRIRVQLTDLEKRDNKLP